MLTSNHNFFVKIRGFLGNKGSFSNFKSHLRHRHSPEFDYFLSKRQSTPSIKQFCVESEVTATRQEQLDKGLAKMIIEESIPLNLLRRNGFRNFIPV